MINRTLIPSILALLTMPFLASCGADLDAISAISSDENSSLTGTDTSNELLEIDSGMLERKVDLPSVTLVSNPDKNAYFGDLHVHTEYSFDAFAFGSLATPRDAYRYALGEAIPHPSGFSIQLDRPLDFYAVTDHAMFLGVAKTAADTDSLLSKQAISEPLHDMNAPENRGFLSLLGRSQAFGQFVPAMVSLMRDGDIDKEMVMDITRTAWADSVDAADEAYQPGSLTTFPAYEYTTSTATRGNLHRNVIFKQSDRLPAVPFSRLNSRSPEGLWDWMDALRDQGMESLAIPHNSNGSDGQMFKLVDWAENPIDIGYSEQRLRNEPLVEVTQIKGTSETHPLLSDTDEWAGFEIMDYRVATKLPSKANGSYARQALRDGLALAAKGSGNPYKFGLIGSTDTHVGGGALREDKYFSKAGLMDGTPSKRGSVPASFLIGTAAKWWLPDLVKEVDGKTYMATNVFEYWGASGLAAVWAEKNDRESIYEAFRRKETFATSGPRIRLRFFAGWDYPSDLVDDPMAVSRAYADGVAMGSDLEGVEGASPSFLVWAMADAASAPLQRLQVIKGWEHNGETHEQVFDVACAGGTNADPVTYRCPDNGAMVNAQDCSMKEGTGAAELKVVWQDPQFDANQEAFYYTRAIENPSCRWSTWEALSAGEAPRSDLPKTIQERAWSSPIWYRKPGIENTTPAA
ncbi:MAG: DUF3604 domain-containing protein [Halioglobus sp.]